MTRSTSACKDAAALVADLSRLLSAAAAKCNSTVYM